LLSDYFENIIPYEKNKYIEKIPYDEADPVAHFLYKNRFTLEEQYETKEKEEEKEDIICIKEEIRITGNNKNMWQKMFPTTSEIIFNNTVYCTYYVVIFIIKKMYNKTVTASDIKKNLFTGYIPYLERYEARVLELLTLQGKKTLVEKIRSGTYTFEEMIMHEGYYLTNLDIWVLATFLKLPIILYASTSITNLKVVDKWLILSGNKDTDAYFFVKSPATSKTEGGGLPEYHILSQQYTFAQSKGLEKQVTLGNIQTLEDVLSTQDVKKD
jgi:hypothetical protein